MKRAIILIILSILLLSLLSCAKQQAGAFKAVFATKDEGIRLLTADDEFVNSMTDLDRCLRMKLNQPVSKQAFLEYLAGQSMEWAPEEINHLESIIDSIRPALKEISYKLPDTVYFVKTTGLDEGGAQYTRGNAIFFPEIFLDADETDIHNIITHELFHIYTRHNSVIKDSLYAIIGFEPCNEIALGSDLRSHKITNPDAPANNYFIRVAMGEDSIAILPLITSAIGIEQISPETQLFGVVRFGLLELVDNDGVMSVRRDSLNAPVMHNFGEVTSYIQRIGMNTNYIFHPEEILAENFVLMINGISDMPNPEITEQMAEILKAKAKP